MIRNYLRYPRLLHFSLLLLTAHLAWAAAEAKRTFNLPSDRAEKTLKLFSEQSGRGLIMGSEAVGAARTNAVRGDFTAPEALTRMLAGTGLLATQDEKSGSFVVHGEKPGPNGPRVAADSARRPARDEAQPASAEEKTVVLSPFEVRETNKGYYGGNTMAGTRLNSKIEDLASSITVITKEQMADFALLDINDIFNYEAGTEGTGNYTDYSFNENGDPVDNTQLDPNNANRIRGIGSANISFGNFSTSGRVPLDPINIDGVEISRGPNSNIFGLGNASGTVNSIPSSANLSRNRSQVQLRGDSYDGYRASLDLNRVLKKGVLAVRASAVGQRDGYVRKPSGTITERYNGMVKYQPFKSTTLTASYSRYHLYGLRANSTPPRDAVSFWKKSGSPTWDPLTQMAFVDGKSIGVFPGTTAGLVTTPTSFTNALIINNGGGSSILNVEPNGSISRWTPVRGVNGANPMIHTGDPNVQVLYHFVTTNPENFRTTQPLFATALAVSDKSLYDWTKYNLAAMNDQNERTATSSAQIDHVFFNTLRQMLAAQAAWFREDSTNYGRIAYATPGATGTSSSRANSGYLYVDPNIRLLDGTPNPNFLRPNIGITSPFNSDNPLKNDTYRAQLAYQVNLTQEKTLFRWLGLHQVSGYAEYKHNVRRSFAYKDAIVDDHSWLAAGVPRGNQNQPASNGPLPYNQASPRPTRAYFQYYVGDNVNQNVDYAPAPFTYGTHAYTWVNAITGQRSQEPAVLGRAASVDGTGGSLNINNILKTGGLTIQSHWLGDRVVTTFGLREDKSFVKYGVLSSLLPDGVHHDFAWDNQWAGDWQAREGRTKTAGVVVKPIPWLYLHLNKSDSFKPAAPAQDLHLRPLPNPGGEGKDYGFSLNLFRGKLGVRVNQYTTKQINSRNGNSTTFARNVREVDIYGFSNSRPFGLNLRSANWLANAAAKRGTTLTPDQLAAQVSEVMQLPVATINALADLGVPIAETDNLTAKGTEIELNFNPTKFWTVKANATRQESFTSAIAPDLAAWLAERTPVWQKIIDQDTGLPWFTYGAYSGNNPSADTYLNRNVLPQFALAKQLEGKSQPQIRKYRFNVSTNYRLAGITEHKLLKRFNVGGALRWEDRGAIGYYGVQKLPAIITDLDVNNPVWGKANCYLDAFVGYRTRLFRDKIGATLQLNVRNLQEGGRLQAISAFPDGTPNAYRIIDPRQFILTATFDL